MRDVSYSAISCSSTGGKIGISELILIGRMKVSATANMFYSLV